MTVQIETYYDFRSPYAYFADFRVQTGQIDFDANVEWLGRPIFIDVILNLQLGRDPWAPFVDTLIPPKRAYLMADIRRMAAYYGAPYKPWWKWPSRPNQVPALCVASLLTGKTEQLFRTGIFNCLWRDGRDVADSEVLRDVLIRAGGDPAVLDRAREPRIHDELTARTVNAYSKGIFGTPTFVCEGEIYFGADRLEVLAWKLKQVERRAV